MDDDEVIIHACSFFVFNSFHIQRIAAFLVYSDTST